MDPSRRSGNTRTTFASCCSTRRTYLAPAFIKIGSELGPPTAYPERLVEPLRELGTQATEHGTRVAIETMPFSIISTVPMGAEIVVCSRSSWIGLLLDAWHVFRAGTSLDELRAALAPEMIFGVELDDAAPGCGRNATSKTP